VRTGPAVIAFGFVIEKFNLFVLAIASSTSAEAAHRLQLDQLQLESLSAGLSRSGGRHHLVTTGGIIPLRRAQSSRYGGQLRPESAISSALTG
jgi:uncharacterized membrane protein YidH (DUF202 family)